MNKSGHPKVSDQKLLKFQVVTTFHKMYEQSFSLTTDILTIIMDGLENVIDFYKKLL